MSKSTSMIGAYHIAKERSLMDIAPEVSHCEINKITECKRLSPTVKKRVKR